MDIALTSTEWGDLVKNLLAATERGDIVWEVAKEHDQEGVGDSYKTNTGAMEISLFGRRQGFWYALSVVRQIPGQSPQSFSITVKSSKASEGVPYNVLSRAARTQIKQRQWQTEQESEQVTVNLILDCIRSGAAVPEDNNGFRIVQHHGLMQQLATELIEATENGLLDWENCAEPGEDWHFVCTVSGLYIAVLLDSENKKCLYVDIAAEQVEDRYSLADNNWVWGPELERLRQTAKASSIRNQEKFLAIARATILEDMLGEIAGSK